MKTAVMIQAHKNEVYLKELAILNDDVRFYIHMDAKFPEKKEWLENQNLGNVFLVNDPVTVFWGGSSQIFATLKLMNLAYSNEDNIFFHLISSECLPLKKFSDIENEWDKNPHLQYIESHLDYSNSWRLKVRVPHSDTPYLRTFLGRSFNKLLKISTLFFDSVKFDPSYHYFGSQWFSVNRHFVGEVILSEREGFFGKFQNITCADEHAFAIFSQMKYSKIKNISDSNKRYILFNGRSSPEYLNYKRTKELKSTGEFWFSRKHDENTLCQLIKEGE